MNVLKTRSGRSEFHTTHVLVFLFPQLSAVDSDAGPNGQVTYRVLAGAHGHFLIGNRQVCLKEARDALRVQPAV